MTREVDSIIDFVMAAKIPDIYPGYTTNGKHATDSYPERLGTPSASGPIGLAVDFDAPDNNPKALLACAELFSPISGLLFELFHTPLHYSIKNGVRVHWTIPDHVTHVHVAVKLGVFLQPHWPTPKPQELPAMPDYVDQFRWPNGDQVQVFANGDVKCYPPHVFKGSVHDVKPQDRLNFSPTTNPIAGVNPHDANNSDAGYVTWCANGDGYDFPLK